MSHSGWYRTKAAECERLALTLTNTTARDALMLECENRLEIAASIDAADAVVRQEEKK
jgi:hypothetical protein